jgi:hypothetical protein
LNNYQDIFSLLVLLLPYYELNESKNITSFDELFLNTENILKDNVKNEIKECSDNLGKEESNNIMSLLLILRDAWKHYSDKEKKLIKKNIKMILSEYCKFLSIDKN